MALKINFNAEAAVTHTALLRNERAMNKSLLRISTGQRILSAADDAAGLFIADQLSLVAAALDQGNKNIQTGISALQIAEANVGQIFEKLQSMYTKAQSAANDINDPNARAALQADIDALVDAIDKIAKDTEYNGITLLDGTFQDKYIHYGPRSGQTITINIDAVDSATLGIDALDVSDNPGAEDALEAINTAIQTVDTIRSKIGSVINNLQAIWDGQKTAYDNTKEAENVIRNTDFAAEMTTFTTMQIRMQASVAMLAQANALPQLVLQLLR